ncbi:MAG: hypothetical protein ACYDGY_00580 [Acidimicrobiales bacterium]
MIHLIRGEVLKYRTLKSNWVLMASGAVITLLIIFMILYGVERNLGSGGGVSGGPAGQFGTAGWYPVTLGMSYTYSQLFGVVLGIICVTGEFRYNTASFTYLVEPRRSRILYAKLIASAIWGLIYGMLTVILVTAFGTLLCSVWGLGPGAFLHHALAYSPVDVAGFALFTLIGVGIGSLVHNQVLAIISGLGMITIGASLLALIGAIAPHVVPYMPQSALMSLERVPQRANVFAGGYRFLPWWGGGLVLLAYTAALAGTGALTAQRPDL